LEIVRKDPFNKKMAAYSGLEFLFLLSPCLIPHTITASFFSPVRDLDHLLLQMKNKHAPGRISGKRIFFYG